LSKLQRLPAASLIRNHGGARDRERREIETGGRPVTTPAEGLDFFVARRQFRSLPRVLKHFHRSCKLDKFRGSCKELGANSAALSRAKMV